MVGRTLCAEIALLGVCLSPLAFYTSQHGKMAAKSYFYSNSMSSNLQLESVALHFGCQNKVCFLGLRGRPIVDVGFQSTTAFLLC